MTSKPDRSYRRDFQKLKNCPICPDQRFDSDSDFIEIHFLVFHPIEWAYLVLEPESELAARNSPAQSRPTESEFFDMTYPSSQTASESADKNTSSKQSSGIPIDTDRALARTTRHFGSSGIGSLSLDTGANEGLEDISDAEEGEIDSQTSADESIDGEGSKNLGPKIRINFLSKCATKTSRVLKDTQKTSDKRLVIEINDLSSPKRTVLLTDENTDASVQEKNERNNHASRIKSPRKSSPSRFPTTISQDGFSPDLMDLAMTISSVPKPGGELLPKQNNEINSKTKKNGWDLSVFTEPDFNKHILGLLFYQKNSLQRFCESLTDKNFIDLATKSETAANFANFIGKIPPNCAEIVLSKCEEKNIAALAIHKWGHLVLVSIAKLTRVPSAKTLLNRGIITTSKSFLAMLTDTYGKNVAGAMIEHGIMDYFAIQIININFDFLLFNEFGAKVLEHFFLSPSTWTADLNSFLKKLAHREPYPNVYGFSTEQYLNNLNVIAQLKEADGTEKISPLPGDLLKTAVYQPVSNAFLLKWIESSCQPTSNILKLMLCDLAAALNIAENLDSYEPYIRMLFTAVLA